MLNSILDNSILIIFLVTAYALGKAEYKKYLERKSLSPNEFRSLLRPKISKIRNEILVKFVVTLMVTVIISVVSFRQLWVNDCFHITFLAYLLGNPIHKRLKSLFE